MPFLDASGCVQLVAAPILGPRQSVMLGAGFLHLAGSRPMPVNPQFIPLTAGQWSPICQLNELRKSLLVCALGLDVVLSPTTNTPTAQLPNGPGPAGIYLEGGGSSPPTIFRLSEAIDCDLVKQEWYAQAAAGSGPPVPHSQLFSATGSWTAPPGVTSIVVIVVGGGGGSFDAVVAAGKSTDGGGGAACAISTLTVVPGTSYVVHVGTGATANPVANADDSWFSLTGIAPVSSADGALAVHGDNGSGYPAVSGGAGGLGASSIGDAVFNGGAGAAGTTDVGFDAGGAGGGGSGYASSNGTAGTMGSNTGSSGSGGTQGGGTGGDISVLSPPPAQDGGRGGLGGGAGGGGYGPTLAEYGLGAAGGDGYIMVSWLSPASGTSVVAVFESFELPEPVETGAITVGLPKLSRGGLLALHDLLDRLGQKGNPDAAMQDDEVQQNPYGWSDGN